MDHHKKNKEKTQKEISIAYQDDSFAAIRTVDDPKNYDKKEEMESNNKHVDEPKTKGNHQEHDRIGKSSETKQVQHIPNKKENREKKEKMERTEDTEFAKEVIAKPYQERSIAHQEISLESKHGKEKVYHEKESCKENITPNGSKVVQSVSRRTEIAEKNKKEETESNKKKSDEQKTQEENQQEHYWIGKSSEKEQVRNIPNVKENIEKKEKTEKTENTEYANKEKREKFDSNRKPINERKSEEGNQHEHNWNGKPSEKKQVQNIPNTEENKEKEKMERTEDTMPAHKGIANSYQEKSKAHQEISHESKQDTENDNEKEICKGNPNPNGSKAVIQRRTKITEKKEEETESNRKHVDELKTEDGNQQDHDRIGNPSEMERTKDTVPANKGIANSYQEQSKAHEDTKEDHEKETSEANMNPNESKPDECFSMTTDIIGSKKEIEVVAKTEDSNGVTTVEPRKLSGHLPKNVAKQNEKKKEGSWFSKYCIIL